MVFTESVGFGFAWKRAARRGTDASSWWCADGDTGDRGVWRRWDVSFAGGGSIRLRGKARATRSGRAKRGEAYADRSGLERDGGGWFGVDVLCVECSF